MLLLGFECLVSHKVTKNHVCGNRVSRGPPVFRDRNPVLTNHKQLHACKCCCLVLNALFHYLLGDKTNVGLAIVVVAIVFNSAAIEPIVEFQA